MYTLIEVQFFFFGYFLPLRRFILDYVDANTDFLLTLPKVCELQQKKISSTTYT